MSALVVSKMKNKLTYHIWTFTHLFYYFSLQTFLLIDYSLFPEHTQDKQIQRDDEYYEGDNDNDHHMDDG